MLWSSCWTEPCGNQIQRGSTGKRIPEAKHKLIWEARCTLEIIWQCYKVQTTKVQIPAPSLIHTTTSQSALSEMSACSCLIFSFCRYSLVGEQLHMNKEKMCLQLAMSWHVTAIGVQLFMSLTQISIRDSELWRSAVSLAYWLCAIGYLRWVSPNPFYLPRNHWAWQTTSLVRVDTSFWVSIAVSDGKHLQLKKKNNSKPKPDKIWVCCMCVFDYVKITCGCFYFRKNRWKVCSISHEDFISNGFNRNFLINLTESNSEPPVLLLLILTLHCLILTIKVNYSYHRKKVMEDSTLY